MSTKYLRNIKDGFIYNWNPYLADNPLCEEVTEEVAYPERFSEAKVAEPLESVEQPVRKPKVSRKAKVTVGLSDADIEEFSVYTSPELAADASRGLP
jgi:hypothetical protein